MLVTVLCEDTGCKYNSGGYYGVCKHPSLESAVPYGGIDRIYKSTCSEREVTDNGYSVQSNEEDR